MIKVISLIKKNNNYKITFSNDLELILNEEVVLKYRLVKNKELEDDIIDNIIEDNRYYEAYTKALKYLSTYIKSSKQIYEYLIKKEYSSEISNEVINNLKDNGFIKDDDIKNNYVSELVRDGYGRLMIISKLKQKGLSTDIIINDIEYEEALERIALKKLKTLKDDKENRLKRYLLGRGYTLSEILRAIRGFNFE